MSEVPNVHKSVTIGLPSSGSQKRASLGPATPPTIKNSVYRATSPIRQRPNPPKTPLGRFLMSEVPNVHTSVTIGPPSSDSQKRASLGPATPPTIKTAFTGWGPQ